MRREIEKERERKRKKKRKKKKKKEKKKNTNTPVTISSSLQVTPNHLQTGSFDNQSVFWVQKDPLQALYKEVRALYIKREKEEKGGGERGRGGGEGKG